MKTLRIIIILLCIGNAGYAQQPQWQWAKGAQGHEWAGQAGYMPDNVPNTGYEWAKCISVMPNGTFYITGATYGNFLLGKDTPVHGGVTKNFFLIQYNANGGINWVKGASTKETNAIEVKAVCNDAAGNAFVTGNMSTREGHDNVMNFGSEALRIPQSKTLFFLVKYDVKGKLQWVRTSSEPEQKSFFENEGSNGNTVSADLNGNVYVAGTGSGKHLIFGTDTVDCRSGFYLVKYDAAGNCKWVRSTNDTGTRFTGLAWPAKVCTDALGNIYCSAYLTGSVTFGRFKLSSGYGPATLVVKFDSGGQVLWAKTLISNVYMPIGIMAVDGNANCYIYQCIQGLQPVTFGNDTLKPTNGFVNLITKLNAQGECVWTRPLSNYNEARCRGLATDTHGNLYAAGYYNVPGEIDEADTVFATHHYAVFGKDTLPHIHNGNAFVEKFDTAGHMLWVKGETVHKTEYADGNGADVFNAVGTDAKDNVYVAGNFSDTHLFLGNQVVVDSTYEDSQGRLFVAKLAQDKTHKK